MAMTDIAPVSDRAGIEERISSLLDDMGPMQQRFLDATVEQLQAWVWKESDLVVETEPQRAVKLGKRRLNRMRKKLRKLERRLPRLVRKRVGKKEFWVHEASAPETVMNIHGGAGFKNPYLPGRSGLPRVLGDAFGYVMTRLGKTHRRFKLGRARWRKSRSVSGMLDYRGTLEPSEEMKDAMSVYAAAADELRAALQELDAVDSEEITSRAKRLWSVGG